MELKGKMGNRNNFTVSPSSLRETSVLMLSSIHPTRLFGGSSFGATRHTEYHPGLPVKSRANGKLSCSKASVICNDVNLNNFCIHVIIHYCAHVYALHEHRHSNLLADICKYTTRTQSQYYKQDITALRQDGHTLVNENLHKGKKHMLLGRSADPRLNKPETVGHTILHQLEWLRYCKSQAINSRRGPTSGMPVNTTCAVVLKGGIHQKCGQIV